MRLHVFLTLSACFLAAFATGETATITDCYPKSASSKHSCYAAFDGLSTSGWGFFPDSPGQWHKVALFQFDSSNVNGVSFVSDPNGDHRVQVFSIQCFQQGKYVDASNVRIASGQAATIRGSMVELATGKNDVRVNFDPVPECEAILLQVFSRDSTKTSSFIVNDLTIFKQDVFEQSGFKMITDSNGPADCGTLIGCEYGDMDSIMKSCDDNDCNLIQWCPANGEGMKSPSCHLGHNGQEARACLYKGCDQCTEEWCDYKRKPTSLSSNGKMVGYWSTYFKEEPETISLDDYSYFFPGCVAGEPLQKFSNKSPAECAELCNANPDCLAFDYGADYREGARYKPKDCSLQSSAHYAGCSGYDNNSKVYIKPASNKPSIFSQVAASGECLSTVSDIKTVLGNKPHTIRVRLAFPEVATTEIQWMLNLGEVLDNGAQGHHWLWNHPNAVKSYDGREITECSVLTSSFDGTFESTYCDGKMWNFAFPDFSIQTTDLYIGKSPSPSVPDFAGCISEVTIWTHPMDIDDVDPAKNHAFFETCRWEETHDVFSANGEEYMGYSCLSDEVAAGFYLDKQNVVQRIACCKLGGHSSIKPETCEMIDADTVRQDGKDTLAGLYCGHDDDHKVFTGAYDMKKFNNEKVHNEVLAGRCCEVTCDASWCENNKWGVNKDKCQKLEAVDEEIQSLWCPPGTMLTEVHDFDSANGGVQKVKSVTCCELEGVAQPTMSPTTSPTSAPSPAPTSAPSISPSVAPTTAPTPSPTTAPSVSPSTSAPSVSPSVAPTTKMECLEVVYATRFKNFDDFRAAVVRCLPCADDYFLRRSLQGRLLNGNNRRQ